MVIQRAFFIFGLMETKVFFTFQELADQYQVNVSHLRYYAAKFNVKGRKQGNTWVFTQREANKFGKILQLAQSEKFTLEGAKEQLNHREEVFNRKGEVIRKLEYIREVLNLVADRLNDSHEPSPDLTTPSSPSPS